MIFEEVNETLPRNHRASSRMVKAIHGGTGAVVIREVPEFSTAAGVPARIIGRRKKQDVATGRA